MSTIWLKLAAVVVVIVVALILIGHFTGGGSSAPAPAPAPPQKNKTFDDMVARDKQFLEEPKLAEPETQAAQAQPATPPVAKEEPAPVQPATPAPQPTSKYILPSSITKPTTLYFKPMSEMDEIEVQRILPTTEAGRSIGRLPMTHFNLMVQGCRQILAKWPDSWYAFRAKQMLEDMPERYWTNYKVTEEELDISKFMKKRPGTEARTVEPLR